jgi:hypothetical protein
MKTKNDRYSYIEWYSAEEMHKASKRWLSELKFFRDEQVFLNNLIVTNTLQLSDSAYFEASKALMSKIQKAEMELTDLFKKVQAHENQLEIMVDDVDHFKMEEAYLETHTELWAAMEEYGIAYRAIKKKLFSLVARVMKKTKQKRLLKQ